MFVGPQGETNPEMNILFRVLLGVTILFTLISLLFGLKSHAYLKLVTRGIVGL
jgi:hypothetical protein